MTDKLHIEIIGQGPPLIMLHGWGWHTGIWQPLTPYLAKHFQLFLLDLPGFGKSPLLTNAYQIDVLAELLFTLIPEKATWLGWSLGGMIAWWIALNYPERVSRLITVASSPKFVADTNWPGVLPETLTKFQHALTENYQQTLLDFLDLQLRGSPNQAELFSILQKQLCYQPSMNTLLNSLELLRTLDLRNDMHHIACPSLHIFGSHDTLVPKEVASLLPSYSRSVIMKRTGHMPFLTNPTLFLNQLLL